MHLVSSLDSRLTHARAVVISFLTFMSVAAFPSFCEDFKVFLRERLNGCTADHPLIF